MIEARDVRKSYRMGAVTLEVLKGLSLRIEPGSFVAITGPSGAGKSTLLHLLAALDTPTGGEVRWDGKSLAGWSDAKRAEFRCRQIGIVFQFYHLLPELTALENVMLPARLAGRGGRAVREQAAEYLERVGLSERVKHRPRELSGGEQQRVAIARALINEPRFLMCDEPTGNLDSATGAEVAELLMAMRRERKTGLVLVTHEAELAERADAQIMLRDGRIVEHRGVR